MIETSKILQTDLLDLLFDDRNKQYGAYELRKKYNKRMIISVVIMIACCLLFFILFAFAAGKNKSHRPLKITDLTLVKVEPEVKKQEVIPPPPKTIQPRIKTIPFTVFKITSDEVKPDEQPPKIDDMEDARIGKVRSDGDNDIGIVAPPISDDKGVIEIPKKQEDDLDKIHLTVEIESEYPGGITSWHRFLHKNIRYPEEAVDREIQGTVLVQFIVDRAGVVSDVEAISGPAELRDEAVRVIKKSGNWKPAIQNGREVKSYKRQPIIFKLENE